VNRDQTNDNDVILQRLNSKEKDAVEMLMHLKSPVTTTTTQVAKQQTNFHGNQTYTVAYLQKGNPLQSNERGGFGQHAFRYHSDRFARLTTAQHAGVNFAPQQPQTFMGPYANFCAPINFFSFPQTQIFPPFLFTQNGLPVSFKVENNKKS